MTEGAPGIEQATDEADWAAFQQLDRLADHWWWRPGWHPDRHYLTWYILFEHDETVARCVAEHQRHVDLPYLDLIPTAGLHMTVQGVGFADEITHTEAAEVADRAHQLCLDTTSFPLTIGPLAGYEGGVFLRASPWAPIANLRERLCTAISDALGTSRVPNEPQRFKPHITVAYCHKAVPAAELIHRVWELRSLPPVEVAVRSVDLIELRREAHSYLWTSITSLCLRSPDS